MKFKIKLESEFYFDSTIEEYREKKKLEGLYTDGISWFLDISNLSELLSFIEKCEFAIMVDSDLLVIMDHSGK